MTRLQCRRATHDARRHLRNLEAGNAFTTAALPSILDRLDAAYHAPDCEPKVARQLHVLIDQIGDWAILHARGVEYVPRHPGEHEW